MKILVDAPQLYGQRTGTAYYCLGLLRALLEIDTYNEYTLSGYADKKSADSLDLTLGRDNLISSPVRSIDIRIANFLERNAYPLPLDLILRDKFDVGFYTDFVVRGSFRKQKKIVVIHDLAHLHYPQFSNLKNSRKLLRQIPRSLRLADRVIVNSESTKADVMENYSVDEGKVSVVYPGVDIAREKRADTAKGKTILERYGIDRDYILYIGTIEPRKNILGILNAYEALPEELRNRYALVLGGGKGWLDDNIHNRLNELKKLNIHILGYVPDDHLATLYASARVFVYPSFYEGFGMPVLESMAFGTPVITSNSSSLPEVVAGAGIIIDANDTAALSREMSRVLTDKALSAKLRSAGFKRAKNFNWEKSAQKLKDIIESLQ